LGEREGERERDKEKERNTEAAKRKKKGASWNLARETEGRKERERERVTRRVGEKEGADGPRDRKSVVLFRVFLESRTPFSRFRGRVSFS
jgi:hypothetical protein